MHPKSGLPVGEEVDVTPALRPERVTIEGRLIRLEPLDTQIHLHDLYEATHGEDKDAIYNYLFDGPFADLSEFRNNIQALSQRTDYIFYAIMDKRSEKAVGYFSLMRIDPVHKSIEVGYVVYGNQLKRTPQATEAQFLLMKYAFCDLNYRRYEWKCDSLNAPSRSAALRLGFVFEGIFRKHFIIKGRNRDTAWFSIVDTEWPVVKQAFELWLSPDNFTEDNVQIRSLSDLRNSLINV